ncbi:MAG: hypothetical protein DU429_06590 [Candidatus Tokpelaia sp.]|nr:MAG: hypothetical protein DU430_04420 [Candidatus Tokpelaia sp.]KAA6206225.1 MAG: hypothetical protein DU429_06590 [Candidatus Tokpelaia sp.]KAA6406037.1 hypothetical protein DPQ22_00865 [Candidatus Tokpelaia sp.]
MSLAGIETLPIGERQKSFLNFRPGWIILPPAQAALNSKSGKIFAHKKRAKELPSARFAFPVNVS